MNIVILILIIQFYIFINHIYTERVSGIGVESPLHPELVSTSNLSCYTCSTIDDPRCNVINETYYYSNYKYSTFNTRLYGSECGSGEVYCVVQRLDAKINLSSQDYKFWAIQRKCAPHCVEGCFVLGERTKLSLCTSCCTHNYCNVGNTGPDAMVYVNLALMSLLLVLSIVCNH